ncbi:MAG: 3-phosphoshikimate 1-carboxyvinyltransferase [Clostridia bacterium]|nr:3-phosphoshikimate 1-carboxyvinyltransferase [Clostridia bacterium]MBR3681531.1 3-phosphoshikimate 1-carboxyvinyltransferase [Clostridia bacterium]
MVFDYNERKSLEMRVVISPARGAGKIKAPPSKSVAHRLLICAALSEGKSVIHDVSDCEDVEATLDCMAALGIKFERKENDVTVFGVNPKRIKPTGTLPCRESGSTLRFFIPILLISGRCAMLSGAPSLLSRPMTVYEDICKKMDYAYISDGKSIAVKGPLRGGEYSVVGNVSSQFISGLLFALPTLSESSRIRIAPPIESRSYIDLTVDALSKFGVRVIWEDEHTLYIEGGQKYTPTELSVEGDYSGAAFPDALNLFGGEVEVLGLNPESIQGDRAYKRYYEQLLRGVPSIHIGNCPDLGPILFAVAAAKNGGIFSGTKRLKIKESDRAEAMASELRKLGAAVTVSEDRVVIFPADFHRPTEPLYGHNDHRIVMSLAILLTVVGGEIIGAEAVKKSYPDFFEDLSALGIGVTVYDA